MIKIHELVRHSLRGGELCVNRHVRLLCECLRIDVCRASELWLNHGRGYIYTIDGVYAYSEGSFARMSRYFERIVGVRSDGSYVVHKRRTPVVRTMVEKYDYHREPSYSEFSENWHEMREVNRMFRDGMGQRTRKRCGVRGTKVMNDYTQRVHRKNTWK